MTNQSHNQDAAVPTKECGICGEVKPINEYCSNDCRFLLGVKPEDAISTILGRLSYNKRHHISGPYNVAVNQFNTLLEIQFLKGKLDGLKLGRGMAMKQFEDLRKELNKETS